MEHGLAIEFLSLLKTSKPPKEKPIVLGKADEVFHIYELVENILSYLPALDLLVLQMVNPTCNRVVSTTKSFQAKLFMTQDPLSSDGADQQKETILANELRWNPFLMHYGTLIPPKPCPLKPCSCSRLPGVRLKLKYVRKEKFDRPNASWKKMFLAHPTRLVSRALVVSRTRTCAHYSDYRSSKEGEDLEILTMEFLMNIDENCFVRGHQPLEDEIALRVYLS